MGFHRASFFYEFLLDCVPYGRCGKFSRFNASEYFAPCKYSLDNNSNCCSQEETRQADIQLSHYNNISTFLQPLFDRLACQRQKWT